jgi:hypothetical protein
MRTLEKPRIFIRDKLTLLSERMLHKDYDRKDSVGKTFLVMSLKGLGAKKKRLTVNRKL